jgi:hypothetical protein
MAGLQVDWVAKRAAAAMLRRALKLKSRAVFRNEQ